MKKRSAGFTLFEVSMVLVIVALIAGGVIVGRDMIRNAELNGVVGELVKYKQAVNNFHDKYYAMPGDFKGAEALWGSDTSCPNTPFTTTPHTATCNGNGDGHIGYYYYSWPLLGFVSNSQYEFFRAWQQLADAGMIDGAYTGISGTKHSPSTAIIGVNAPASKLPGAGWTLEYWNLPNGSPYSFPAIYGHVLVFGATGDGWDTYLPVLTPAEALSLDSKMDDGLPASGKILAGFSSIYPNCTTSDTPSASRYKANYSGIVCGLNFITGL